MEPSLHSGINAAVLLIAVGQHFEDSEELQLIGEPAPSHCPQRDLGRERGEKTLGFSQLGLSSSF
jgi:hypothetical protein